MSTDDSESSDYEYEYEEEGGESALRDSEIFVRAARRTCHAVFRTASGDDVSLHLTTPQYVVATRIIGARRGLIVAPVLCRVAVAIDRDEVRAGHVVPRVTCTQSWMRGSRDVATATVPLVVVSARVVEQDARAFPIDFMLSLFDATRPYVVRRHLLLTDLDVETITDGRAYSNRAAHAAFCSLDAHGFDAAVIEGAPGIESIVTAAAAEHSTLARAFDSGWLAVPKSYRFASLLREVTLARSFERLSAVEQRYATLDSLDEAPLETSDSWLYARAETLIDAVRFVDERLVPGTRRRFDASGLEPLTIHVDPLGDTSWARALGGDPAGPRQYTATVTMIVYVAAVR